MRTLLAGSHRALGETGIFCDPFRLTAAETGDLLYRYLVFGAQSSGRLDEATGKRVTRTEAGR